jgi:hypothetical protein
LTIAQSDKDDDFPAAQQLHFQAFKAYVAELMLEFAEESVEFVIGGSFPKGDEELIDGDFGYGNHLIVAA